MVLNLRGREINMTTGNIQLIVTGEMEEKALPTALSQAFPELSFNLKTDIRTRHFNGITSTRMPQHWIPNSPVSKLAYILASKLVDAVDPGRNGTPVADMAIVIDDLELANRHQPTIVVQYFRSAVIEYVNTRWSNYQKQQSCFNKVRNNCSFHLFVPMTEAYFFGEPNALIRAGATQKSTVSGKNIDVENFEVTHDTNYLAAPKGTSFWAENPQERPLHPKRYLDYLCCQDLNKNKKKRYRETYGGVNALKTLDWESVFSGNPSDVKYLRSLFEDISWRFNLPNPYFGECAPVTAYKTGRDKILRNI
jgi:hypothetical protein